MDAIRQFLTQLGSISAHPAAFLTVVVYGALWYIFERHSFDWHGVATLATWMMTLFIQRSEHRDTQAIHGKLDELLRSLPGAKGHLADLDKNEPEEIEKLRQQKNGQ